MELIVRKHLITLLCLSLSKLSIRQTSVSHDDIASRSNKFILLLIRSFQQRYYIVALRSEPHVVLILTRRVQGGLLLVKHCIVTLISLHIVINLLSCAVMIRVGQVCQPRKIQLISVCHKIKMFKG